MSQEVAAREGSSAAPEAGAIVADTLESIAREGARRMLARMLAEEVDEFLGRPRYAPGGRATGYRNGYAREREVGTGTWSVPVRQPRVSDPPAGSEPFTSDILPKRRYLSTETQHLFASSSRPSSPRSRWTRSCTSYVSMRRA